MANDPIGTIASCSVAVVGTVVAIGVNEAVSNSDKKESLDINTSQKEETEDLDKFK